MNIRKRSWTYKGAKHTAWRLDGRSRGKGQPQFKTRREGELFRDKLIRDGEAEKYGLSPDPVITFEKFAEVYAEKEAWKSESYRARVLGALGLVPFAGERLAAVMAGQVIAHRDDRLKTKAPATVHQDLAALKDCFK